MRTSRTSNQGALRGAGSGEGHVSERRSWSQALAVLAAIAVSLTLALYMFVPPPVVPADAPDDEFSAGRAMEDVRAISSEPHPMGSEEHEEVADYIVGRLEELGLSPRVQETTSLRYDDEGVRDQVQAGRVKNILARIPGTDDTGEAVLLMSHYDSMPTTPAAADGGVSTATVLETVRTIQVGPPPKNDVIVYIGDADVNGVLGPIAFHEHPWSRDVGVGFAFEGVGSYGPSSLVYDAQGVGGAGTDPDVDPAQLPVPDEYPAAQNGRWLGEALEVLPRPLLVLPLNSTPFAVAASPELGLFQVGTEAAGLGFGQFRGGHTYHTVLDNPDRLDPRSLQHQGQNALALTRHFGDLPLDRVKQQATPSLVAFNVMPGQAVSYPSTWSLPAPRLEVLDDDTRAGTRDLRLRLGSSRGAPYAHLEANLPGEWTRASVDGEKIAASEIPAGQRRRFALTFYNLPEGGVEITLSVRSAEPIDAALTDYSNGLPDVPGMEIEPRPPEFMPAPYDFRDPTAVYRSVEL